METEGNVQCGDFWTIYLKEIPQGTNGLSTGLCDPVQDGVWGVQTLLCIVLPEGRTLPSATAPEAGLYWTSYLRDGKKCKLCVLLRAWDDVVYQKCFCVLGVS